MKTSARWIIICALLCFNQAQAAPVSTNQPGFRLTVELQDGSRIIGKSGDKDFQFKSEVLGEIKLPLEQIRSIECTPKTNSAKLTMVNGDVLAAQFTMKVVRVESAFGDFKLPVNLLKRVQISKIGRPAKVRPGLVALWSGEGDGHDSVGDNDGTLEDGVRFAPGQMGQAFKFNGTSGYVQVGGSYPLTGARTIEAWVYPSTNTGFGLPIITGGPDGLDDFFGIAGTTGHCDVGQYNLYIDHFGTSCYNGGRAVTPNAWNHVAVVYTGSTLQFFVNGVPGPVISGSLYNYNLNTCIVGGNINPSTSTTKSFFSGLIDELAVYNRALSTEEIQTIYVEGNDGDPLPPLPTTAPSHSSVGKFQGKGQ